MWVRPRPRLSGSPVACQRDSKFAGEWKQRRSRRDPIKDRSTSRCLAVFLPNFRRLLRYVAADLCICPGFALCLCFLSVTVLRNCQNTNIVQSCIWGLVRSNKLPHSFRVLYQSGWFISQLPCLQAPTLNLAALNLSHGICSTLGSRPISFPSLFLLSSPLSHGMITW